MRFGCHRKCEGEIQLPFISPESLSMQSTVEGDALSPDYMYQGNLVALVADVPELPFSSVLHVECAQMYQMFQQHLGENFTESPGVAKYRLLDMYCKCTEPDMKEAILREFCALMVTCG